MTDYLVLAEEAERSAAACSLAVKSPESFRLALALAAAVRALVAENARLTGEVQAASTAERQRLAGLATAAEVALVMRYGGVCYANGSRDALGEPADSEAQGATFGILLAALAARREELEQMRARAESAEARHRDEMDVHDQMEAKLHADHAAQLAALREALVGVIAHTGLPPYPSRDLLLGLLASCARIANAALVPPDPTAALARVRAEAVRDVCAAILPAPSGPDAEGGWLVSTDWLARVQESVESDVSGNGSVSWEAIHDVLQAIRALTKASPRKPGDPCDCAVTHAELTRLSAEVEAAERRGAERALAELDAEPEMPGPMPDEMWEAIRGDRDATEEAMRIAVRQTKAAVRQRVFPAPATDTQGVEG